MAASLTLLVGCSSTPQKPINTAPAPWFPSCETICDSGRKDAPESVWRDWVRVINVMLKLDALQDSGDKAKFSECKCEAGK